MIWRDREVAVHESGRKKTMHIVVERDGSLAVQVPRGFPESKIHAVLERRSYSIFAMLAKWRDAHVSATSSVRSDWTVLYGGKRYHVEEVDSQQKSVAVCRGRLVVRRSPKGTRTILREFLRQKAKVRIIGRLAVFAKGPLLSPKKVVIREMATRWGSCTPGGTINYNWRCVQMPPKVMDYLIVHELVHLEYHAHSPAFWSRVEEVVPNYRSAILWLRKNGVRIAT